MNFQPGQEVVCIKKDPWIWVIGPRIGSEAPGPRYNEILTIRQVEREPEGAWEFLVFDEYPGHQGYSSRWFRHILSNDDLVRALEDVEEMSEVMGETTAHQNKRVGPRGECYRTRLDHFS